MPLKNSAFVFVKPHAQTEAVVGLVREEFAARGISITSEGKIDAATIEKGMHIDQHYYAIASKATLKKPNELPVPGDKFEAKFGKPWATVLENGEAYNALDACEKLGIDAAELDSLWGAAKKADQLVKFGGGFYCGLIKDIYVFNGFFMSMRSAFVAPGASVYYFAVDFDPAALAWADFRGKVLGPTDPAEAPAGSLRGRINADWQSLGLKAPPNTGDNGVHASASPFEGLAERANWLSASIKEDAFGAALIAEGIAEATIKEWTVDPQVTHAEGKGSCFDLLEDLDAAECVAKCKTITGLA